MNFKPMRRVANFISDFLATEASGGIILMFSALFALLIANSPLADTYFHTLHIEIFGLSLLHWINDGLMATFFLLVGLEIKREFLTGELSDNDKRILPGIAAVFGVAFPAIIYCSFNWGSENIRGWAIPTATDIAFALGVLALLGDRIPISLKVFLTALAIIDDLIAVLIIALFYSSNLSIIYLGLAGLVIVALWACNYFGVRRNAIYLGLGLILWFFTFKSGIHATLAGVATAIFIPLNLKGAKADQHHSPLVRLEHKLHIPVAFFIVPLFGFANAGVSLHGVGMEYLGHGVTLGIWLGLFLGKIFGVFSAIFVLIKFKIAKMPEGADFKKFFGIAILTGIGFTMSLFVGNLAFAGQENIMTEVKLGVLLGSICAGVFGFIYLKVATSRD